MFKDVQRLKLKILQDELVRLRSERQAMQNEVVTLKEQLRSAKARLTKLEWQEKNGMCAFRGKNYSPWERSEIKRREYQAYQTALTELKELTDKVAVLPFQITVAEMEARDKTANHNTWQKIQNVQQQMFNLKQATSLAQLGITPAEAVQILESHNISPVLDESDQVIFERPRAYQNVADFIAVHQMQAMPLRNRLISVQEAKVKFTKEVTLDEETYKYAYRVEHNNVHFSLNGANPALSANDIQEHDSYAILQPLKEIPRGKICGITAADTFTRGGVDLTPNAWILCPVEKVKMVQKFNPHVHVLGYRGGNVRGFIAPIITQLGYRAEQVKLWGWDDLQSQQALENWLKREKLPAVRYYQSTDYEDNRFRTSANQVIAMLQMMLNEGLIQSVSDFKRLRPQLFAQTDFHFAMKDLTRSTMITDPTLIDATAVVANHQQMVVLAEKMAQTKMFLSDDEKMALQTQFTDATSDHARQLRNGLSNVEWLTRMLVNRALRAFSQKNQNICGTPLESADQDCHIKD